MREQLKNAINAMMADVQVRGTGVVTSPPDALVRVKREYDEAVARQDLVRMEELHVVLMDLQRGSVS
jgi:hypothetical protein